MLCLPEQVVYGWMMQLPVADAQMMTYLWKFYQCMWEHFVRQSHAPVNSLVKERLMLQRKKTQLEQELAKNDTYMELVQLEHQIKKLANAQNRTLSQQVKQAELQFTEELPKELGE